MKYDYNKKKEGGVVMRRRKYNKKTLLIIALAAVLVALTPAGRIIVAAEITYMYDTISKESLKAMLSGSTKEACNVYLSAVDEKMVEMFYEDNGKILYGQEATLFTETYWSTVASSEDAAAYAPGMNTIVVYDDITTIITPAIVHELGHYIDNKYGVLSSTDKFIAIGEEELDDFTLGTVVTSFRDYVRDDYKTNGGYSEFFAEVFAAYYIHPNFLKAISPKAYTYMEALEKGILEGYE